MRPTIPDSVLRELFFEIAVVLLRQKDAAVRIADALRVPLPFAIAFEEELDEIAQSRIARRCLRAGRDPAQNAT